MIDLGRYRVLIDHRSVRKEFETRCNNCTSSSHQCMDCEDYDEMLSVEEKCELSKNKVVKKDCQYKYVTCKLEACLTCGFTYTYP